MAFASVDGVNLYYEQHGDAGEHLVFVHGYTGDTSDWLHQVAEFATSHRVLVLDNRGHGKSEAPSDRGAYGVERMTADLAELTDQLGIDRYHLVGHSMGGTIAQELALQSPERLLSLTLHDTSYSFSARKAHPAMTAWIENRFRIAETQGMRAVAEMKFPLPPPPHMPEERIKETTERLARMSVDAFIGAWQGLAAWEGTAERAHAIAAPTLVVYGDQDAAPITKGSAKLADMIPNAQLQPIPECGHSPNWERPKLFNDTLATFLRSTVSGNGA
ncbi:MAG: alpha/beta fold hydrolase [Dehalococcoidia bacterium]